MHKMNPMIRIAGCIGGILLLFINHVVAQTTPVVDVDVAQFKSFQHGFTKLEIYQGVERKSLNYKTESGKFISLYRIETEIAGSDFSARLDAIVGSDTVSSVAQVRAGQRFVYATSGDLKPGNYKLTTTVFDDVAKTKSAETIPLEIRDISASSLLMSDIQLATDISKADATPSQFDKYSLRITPNVQSSYGDDLETFCFYAEVYNLAFDAETNGSYRVNYIIEDFEGNTLFKIPGKSKPKKNADAVVYVSFDISSLPTGQYQFKAEVFDEDIDSSAVAIKPFNVYRNQEAMAMQVNTERNIYSSIDEQAIDNYITQIEYICTEDEKRLVKELSLEGKREFLINFWRDRDPTPGTPRNEFKEDYILRLMKARIHFFYGDVEGWRSDRGRILLIYGTPEFIDREYKSSRKNGYEIWEYHELRGQGTHQFIFIDTNENSSYPLIHSTFRDEIQNSEWENYLYK